MTKKTSFVKWIKRPSNQIALFAIIISTFGLLYSVYYNRKTLELTKIHNELSVKPILHFNETINRNEGFIAILLTNKGLGPATLKQIDFVYEKRNYSKYIDFLNLIRNQAIKDSVKISINHHQIFERSSLSADESVDLVKIFVEPSAYVDSIANFLEHVLIEIKYSDIYNNEFHGDIEL